ncbi:SDR family oxidoreductase [Catenuloplanes indicus]|uniref:NAD(P)-dependent dehydrogenase (Short-subunit alcohol dehydrogenase family) n=1 Tax=Catenuloplanes indicus TaxID=137267 RepID=A0AAE3W8T1_9ACTN|nr:SDR family oxidoreductase [Catenuloplanes indicus]MDQ0371352.1 NAD(P)-dependent dehydrogenase (short-subunit alcohol dehydrogenase family) [Catenuloplanes indicus]
MGDTRVVLVTGAGTGFGRLAVEALAARGHTVFAAMRDVEGRNRPAAEKLAAVARVIELDVTDQDAATRAVETVVGTAGRLDVVINNAGQVFAGPVEAYTAEEVLRQLDVNVLGALRVNRAALPHLRVRGRGLLIQVSSTSDRVTVPFTGLYSASKAALASLTEAWRYELAGSGVESVSLEAAPHTTELGAKGTMPADAARLEPYLPALGAFMTDLITRQQEQDGDPQPVADALVRLVEAADGTRPHRTVVGPAVQVAALDDLNRAAAEAARIVGADMGIAAHMR